MKTIKRLLKFYFSEKKKVTAEIDINSTLSSQSNMSNLEILDGLQLVNQFLHQKIETMPRDEKMENKLCYFELKCDDCFPISIIEKEYSARKLKPVGFNTLVALDPNWVKTTIGEHSMLGTTFINDDGDPSFFFLSKDNKVCVLADGIIAYDIVFVGMPI